MKHDHRRSLWLIAGGRLCWCYQCGAWRVNELGRAMWHRPSGLGGENPAMKELFARSNATGPGTSQATPGQDEKSTPGGVERDAARYRQIRSKADWDNEGGHGGWTISVRDRAGLRLSNLDAAIDAQIKTGEAPCS